VKVIVIFKDFFGNCPSFLFGKTRTSNKSCAIGGMNVGKPLGHTNYTTRLMCLDFEFDSTLLPLEFALEDSFARNLSGITKGEASSEL
jgi:hypothetical protein